MGDDSKPRTAASALLVGHANTAAVGWVGVAVAWVEQVEDLFGEVQPACFVEITCVVFANFYLEIALPIGDDLMIRLSSWRKIIWFVDALLVKIYVNMRQPLVVLLNARGRFNLGHPGPIAVEVKKIMVGAPTRPGFVVAGTKALDIYRICTVLVIKIDVAIASIGVQTRIHNDHGVF